ncbi:MAG: heat shock protein HspQ [Gammaproteobacteria bacterium]|nr:heat shock protein HspQ [Gammaproteobacteria bacterium]MCP5406523.1 heat shock protein HspQ [Chromatiaceae bacterium]MCP5444252.1 heat shock protein HspQ [Chromatiaceae bacterium]
MERVTEAALHIGQVVHHKLFDYRGVIYDVDPVFMLPDEWYEQVALSRPPKDEPWYRVLVDGSFQETYVAERNLEADTLGGTIDHPHVQLYFEDFKGGQYRPRNRN